MVKQIKVYEGNSIALELTDSFTMSDALFIELLFEEKLSAGHKHVNILIKVKDMSILRNMEFKAFWEGEIWAIRHFGKIGRCAVVAHSNFIKGVVKVESKVLHFFNNALEEKYFDTEQLDEALKFIEG